MTIGLAVMFDRPCDRVGLCCTKSRFGKIGPDNALLCANCGALRGHLSPQIATQLTDIISTFGALPTPIVLRGGGWQ